MLKVGLTGGIGSGKSTVASIFEILGVPVYYADTRAKELMEQNENIIYNIRNYELGGSFCGFVFTKQL
jgi:dephospho-CoA kinase